MKPLVGKGTRESPIVLDDDDDIESKDLKPAAIDPGTNVSPAPTLLPFTDATCAICLDTPISMTDVATISGCTHEFCFDCIDRWAATENSCPCCKARFRTIDRVVPLPPNSIEAAALSTNLNLNPGTARTSRSSTDHSTRRINSRTVEDRMQPSVRASIERYRLWRREAVLHSLDMVQTSSLIQAETGPVSVTVPMSTALERYRLRRREAVLHSLDMVQTASLIQAETGLDVNAVLEQFRLRRREAELHGLAMSSILAEAGLDVSEASASSIAAPST